MAITFALVEATTNRLRYLATQDGQAGVSANIPNDGGGTPDLLTDILSAAPNAGPLHRIINARNVAFPPLTGGALTQVEARALLLSDDPASSVLTNDNIGRCVVTITPRTGVQVWGVDADIDGQGDPILTVVSTITGASAATAYVDLHFRTTEDL